MTNPTIPATATRTMTTPPSTNPQVTESKAPTGPHDPASGGRFGRRALLPGGAAGAGIGAILGVGAALGIPALRDAGPASGSGSGTGSNAPPAVDPAGFGCVSLFWHGRRQAGVRTTPVAHTRYVAYTLKPETDRGALERMFRILTGDIEGLTSGAAPLADSEPELAERPSNLTITIGVGPELVTRAGTARIPKWLAPLPEFERDRFDGTHNGGDLLIILQSDDPMPLAHAARMLERDLRSFADVLWSQQGFRQARGAEPSGTTMRNLMGQVDGTVNPSPTEEDFSSVVWIDGADGAEWLSGGSALVLRRIRMHLDTWDMVDRPGREQTIGRTISDGAPLTGGSEHTPIDFDAKNANGLPVIPSFAHVRRAHSTDPNERIFRRSANFDEGGESGLLFACYQRDPLTQFVPIQRRLDELDLLNEWVEHTGSAVFAILPGFTPERPLGASLLA